MKPSSETAEERVAHLLQRVVCRNSRRSIMSRSSSVEGGKRHSLVCSGDQSEGSLSVTTFGRGAFAPSGLPSTTRGLPFEIIGHRSEERA